MFSISTARSKLKTLGIGFRSANDVFLHPIFVRLHFKMPRKRKSTLSRTTAKKRRQDLESEEERLQRLAFQREAKTRSRANMPSTHRQDVLEAKRVEATVTRATESATRRKQVTHLTPS